MGCLRQPSGGCAKNPGEDGLTFAPMCSAFGLVEVTTGLRQNHLFLERLATTGAIIGAGLRGGFDAIQWQTVAHLIMAWVITLPVAGTLAAGVSLLLRS